MEKIELTDKHSRLNSINIPSTSELRPYPLRRMTMSATFGSTASIASLQYENIHSMSDDHIRHFRDIRGFNYLMLASESGRVEAVKNLIERNILDVNFEVNGESAVKIAQNRGHHEIVLMLLKVNSKYPQHFQHGESHELKNFVQLSQEMHAKVCEASDENLEDTKAFLKHNIEANPSLRHFYNTNNCSLLKRAILCRKFSLYEFLLSLSIFLAPHESMDEINEFLTDDERATLSDINLNASHNLVTEPMMILTRNTKLSPDSPKERKEEFLGFIRDAYNSLFMIPVIAIILKIVAASQKFTIIFDFKRDSVTFLDPKSEPFVEGLAYLSGKIYIGAKDMLNVETAHKVVGVIAHELTHYAMFLVYGNYARPYRFNDSASEDEFDLISVDCMRVKEAEEIVQLVYECYTRKMRHAELIVRVPHMIAYYVNNPERLNELRRTFQSLFNFFEQICVPEMERELPRIKEANCPIRKGMKRNRRQKFWILCLIAFILVILSAFAMLWTNNDNTKVEDKVIWSGLNFQDRNRIKDSILNFYGVEVKFRELFANDSKVFDLLSSEQIKKALKGETEELSRALDETFGPYVFLTWSNMTQKLKEKFLTCEVDFQGQKVSIGKLTKNYKTLEILSSDQIREILSSKFKISFTLDTKDKVYIERFVMDENSRVMSERHCKELRNKKETWHTCYYKNGQINVEDSRVKDFEHIVQNVINLKVFLLSSAAGDGKSTTFRHFSLKLKEKFPQKWIQFVDLKKHIKVFESGQKLNLSNFEVLSNFLGEKLLSLEGFELEIFKELFASGNMIFLWDGVDEVSPHYKKLMLDLTGNIKKTKNSQFVSTRPQHSKDFQRRLSVSAQKLIPFSELDRFEFLVKSIAVKKFKENPVKAFNELKKLYNATFDNFNDSKYYEPIARAQKIFIFSEEISDSLDRFVSNPLLIAMIFEISCDDDFQVMNSYFNSYEFYSLFVQKKFALVRSKGEIVQLDVDRIFGNNSTCVYDIHQFYALKLITRNTRESISITNTSNLIQNIEKLLKVLNHDEISRFGVLQVNSDEDFYFAHKTFEEFFVAGFILEKVLSPNVSMNFDLIEDRWSVLLLFEIWIETQFPVIKTFLEDASKLEEFNFDFFKIWHENQRRTKKLSNDTKMLEVIQFSNIFNMQNLTLAGSSKECLPNLPDLNQIEETFGPDFVRSILNYRQIGDILPPFYCSIRSEAGDEVPMQFLQKAKTFLNRTEIVSLLLDPKGFDGKNSFAEAAERRNLSFVKDLWNLSETILDESQSKKFLSNSIQYSAYNKDPKVFEFLKETSESKLNRDEILRSFTQMAKSGKFSFDEIVETSLDTGREVMLYLQEFFEKDNLQNEGFKMSQKTKDLLTNY